MEKQVEHEQDEMEFKDLSRKSQWIALAIMSGACAAFNGVFAKLYVKPLSFMLYSTRSIYGMYVWVECFVSTFTFAFYSALVW